MIHGGTYHVMNRGNRKALIFHDDRDRRRFTRILIESADEHEVEILGGTQMGTHFHLVITTPHANVPVFMQHLEGRFADYINARHGFTGHLFQGPYVGVVIESDIHLFTAMWYVFDNPCKAGLCERFEDWPWSTYAATVGVRPVPSYLSIDWLQTLFPADSLEQSQRLFRQCMEDPDPIDAYLFAVDPACEAAVRSFISERLRGMSQPFSYREAVRPSLTQLFGPNQSKQERNSIIRSAKISHGYTLAEIANAVQLHPGSVSRIVCRQRDQASNEGAND
jgi:REP element-mobilizing transposase RayT